MPEGWTDDKVAELLGALVLKAAVPVMQIYGRAVTARLKVDQSPVTDADEQAEALILAELARLFPNIPVVAEEAATAGNRPAPQREMFLVDPLDGTREFLARNGEFTVNIGLVRDGVPVCGAVFAPAFQRLWIGAHEAFEMTAAAGDDLPARSEWRKLSIHAATRQPVALVSRSHLTQETLHHLDRIGAGERRPMGSSLKFGLIASGEADITIRIGPTMEWDTAAGDAVLRAAGGFTTTLDGKPMRYGKADVDYRNEDFVAGTRSAGVYPSKSHDSLRFE